MDPCANTHVRGAKVLVTAQHTKEERKKTDVVQDRPCTSFSPLCKTVLKYSTDYSWHILRYFVICNGNANIVLTLDRKTTELNQNR